MITDTTQPTPVWTLPEALSLIRDISPVCTNAGFFVALAGGVLLYDSSTNDVDILLVPRTDNPPSAPVLFSGLLGEWFLTRDNPIFFLDRVVLRLSFHGKPVDLTIMNTYAGGYSHLSPSIPVIP